MHDVAPLLPFNIVLLQNLSESLNFVNEDDGDTLLQRAVANEYVKFKGRPFTQRVTSY